LSQSSQTQSCAVTLWLPDFFSPGRVAESESLSQLKLPALQTLLSKGQRLPLPNTLSQSATFFRTASYLAHQPNFVPIAPTMAAIEVTSFAEQQNHFWVKVDPVHLVPDRDTLLMMPQSQLGVTEAESQALLNAFNEHFAEDGLQLLYGAPNSWYLSVVQQVDLHTTSLPDATMTPLMACSPQGNAANYWLKLMNETQMLFYTHPVNEARREQGQPEINGVWVWGEGKLDFDQIQTKPDLKVFAQSAYLKGLAKLAGAEVDEILPEKVQNPQSCQAILAQNSGKHLLFVMDSLAEQLPNMTETQWLEVLQDLEQVWWQPLLQALKAGQVHSLLLVLGNGMQYHLQPKDLKRFWRLNRKLTKLL